MSEYVFRLKKGELELELRSDDPQFIETQMANWRNLLMAEQQPASVNPRIPVAS